MVVSGCFAVGGKSPTFLCHPTCLRSFRGCPSLRVSIRFRRGREVCRKLRRVCSWSLYHPFRGGGWCLAVSPHQHIYYTPIYTISQGVFGGFSKKIRFFSDFLRPFCVRSYFLLFEVGNNRSVQFPRIRRDRGAPLGRDNNVLTITAGNCPEYPECCGGDWFTNFPAVCQLVCR